jgi:hypothetical protein
LGLEPLRVGHHLPAGAIVTDSNLLDLRSKLEVIRREVDALLGVLGALTPPLAASTTPTLLVATEYAKRCRIGMISLRVYMDHGCPHQRRGRAYLFNPVEADAWIAANREHPAVAAAVRQALDANRGAA